MSEVQMPPVTSKLIADVTGFVKGNEKARQELKETESQASKSHGGIAGSLGGIGAAAAGIATGLAVAGAAAIGFGLKSADEFSKVGGEVLKLQRFTGGTAEDMSKLRFAGEESGVGVDQLANALKFLGKNIETKPAEFAKFGIAIKDSKGNALSMSDVMLNTADAFSKLQNGPEKTAMALKIFGKAGTDMIPMLNKGRDGLTELMGEAQKYGLVLTGSNLDAVKKATMGHRQMDAAMSGLQVTIGQYVLPVVATLTGWFAEQLPKAIGFVKVVIGWVVDAWGTLVAGWSNPDAKNAIGGVTGFLIGFGSTARDVFEWVKAYVIDTVLPALKDAAADAFGFMQTAWAWLDDHKMVLTIVGGLIGGLLVGAFIAWGVSATAAAVATLAAVWPLLLIGAAIGALVAGLVYAYNHWKWFHDAVDKSVAWLKTNVPPMWDKLVAGAKVAFGWLQEHVPPIWAKVQDAVAKFGAWWTGSFWPACVNVFNSLKQVLGEVVGFFQSHWTQISAAVSSAWDLIKNLIANGWAWILNTFKFWSDLLHGNWGAVWDDIKNALSIAWDVIKSVVSNGWDIIKNYFMTAGDFIQNIGSTMWDGIKDGFRAAINWIIDAWNRLSFTVPSVDLGPLGTLGGGTIDFPNIPRLAHGAFATARPGGMLANIAEAGQDEIVSPVPMLRQIIREETGNRTGDLHGGGRAPSYTLHIDAGAIVLHPPAGTDPRAFGREVVGAIAEFVRAGGTIPWKAA
jgi:hypothetical protein